VLKEKFSQYGELERVKKLAGYAFIHFENRDDAEKALKNILIDTVSSAVNTLIIII
jgi:RNA recognition motif-containing protein